MNSPFDERKYKRLLKGLEASEVKKSQLLIEKDNENFRMDSEFFQKKFILDEVIIKKSQWDYLGNLSKSIINFGAYSLCNFIEFLDYGIPYLNVADIKENVISWETAKKIDENLSNGILHKSLVAENQVLLTIAGTIGNAAVAYKLPKFTNSNQAIANITTDSLNPFYLSVYLNSRFGRGQTKKLTISSVQPNLLLTQVKRIKVPILSKDFQKQIEKIYLKSFEIREQSKSLYREAETLLLQELGLVNFTPSNDNVSVKTLAESFLSTGRLDAEYYQKKYEEFEKKLKKHPGETLQNICSAINYGTVPTSPYTEDGQGIPYIKGMNLSHLQITHNLDRITNAGHLPGKFYTRRDDIIISQMGTVGDVGVVTKEEEGFLFASFTIRIRIANKQKYNPYYVGLFIQNIAKDWYLFRNIAQASVRQNTDLPTIRNMDIPVLNIEIQRHIAALIQKSFSLRKKSEELLEEAKAAVEAEIEGEKHG